MPDQDAMENNQFWERLLHKTQQEIAHPEFRSGAAYRMKDVGEVVDKTGKTAVAFSGACHMPIDFAGIDQHLEYCAMQNDPDVAILRHEARRLSQQGLIPASKKTVKTYQIGGTQYFLHRRYDPVWKCNRWMVTAQRDLSETSRYYANLRWRKVK